MMKLKRTAFGVFLFIFFIDSGFSQDCVQRFYAEDSFVCVCDESFCDFIGTITPPAIDEYFLLSSSRDGFRFQKSTGSISTNANGTTVASVTITANFSDIRQTMVGFGGAFTDSAGINIASLSSPLQDILIRSYFAFDGLEYNVGRIPIAGCDFSTRPYSYDDVAGDTDLQFFNLTFEDHLYKIPYIKQAMNIASRPLLFFGSPWAPPYWMKTNQMVNGSGGLIPEMSQPWANYFVKFVEAYEGEGVSLWGLTAQNEPTAGTNDYKWNCCRFTAEEQRDFVRDFLGPTLSAASLRRLKLMVADESRHVFPEYPTTVLDDPIANSYVDGVAVHWYANEIPPLVLTQVHDRFPNKFLLYTEACNGYLLGPSNEVRLGAWNRAETYAADIIQDVNHWSAGWVDWNLALDLIGGPNWVANYVDSPIIVNATANEFYKQPMFYALGHFSKFISEGATSVDSIVSGPNSVKATAFLDVEGKAVVVFMNEGENIEELHLTDEQDTNIDLTLQPRSIHTIVYNRT